MLQINNFEQETHGHKNKNSMQHRSNPNVLYLGIILFLIFFFTVITFFVSKYYKRSNLSSSHTVPVSPAVNLTVAEKVGKENIYKEVLDTEYANYPLSRSASVTKHLLAKIAKDSIILQAGQAEGLISLDATVFNSPDVNYEKRIQLVSKVEDVISQRENKVSGSVISIWFDNFSPGSVGYDKGKQIAYTTIQTIYNQLKNKNISISQATQFIINDAELARVDPSYKSNALLNFTANASDTITYVPAFDAMIRKLSPGKLTPIYLAKDTDRNKKTVDAVYMFAQVTSKKDDGQNENFDEWYGQKQKAYEITIY